MPQMPGFPMQEAGGAFENVLQIKQHIIRKVPGIYNYIKVKMEDYSNGYYCNGQRTR